MSSEQRNGHVLLCRGRRVDAPVRSVPLPAPSGPRAAQHDRAELHALRAKRHEHVREGRRGEREAPHDVRARSEHREYGVRERVRRHDERRGRQRRRCDSEAEFRAGVGAGRAGDAGAVVD